MALINPTRRLMTRQRKRANLEYDKRVKLRQKRASKQGKFSPSNIEVSLGAEETHVHLHLGVQVAHAHLNSLAIFNLKLSFFVNKLM